MINKNLNYYANKIVNAFLKNRIISPIPNIYTKKLENAQKFRKICESKIKKPIIGFKAAGTGIPVLKKLKEKEPFYATVFKHNVLQNKKSVKINNYTMGIELEVCYVIKKEFFNFKQKISKKNIKKFITYIAPCIEVVGYRQKKKGIKSLGDLCSDFGANVKFVIGPKKKFKNNNVINLKTTLQNKKINHLVKGNTNTVYINPMNSLLFVLKKIQKDKIYHDDDFFVFTGSSVGVVPILSKGVYKGVIEKLGSVSTNIN
ncbi:fumarylacetoacetate hydrolase [Pelagibacteraceae bacterium]|jgi:2-keto-4-pentenoate hydratase|nr:fumarylacetoacetate hydrolase [Pelagibacteraceae bacterium]